MPYEEGAGAIGSCRAVNLVPPERNREAMDEELIAAMAGGDHSAVRHAFSGRNVMNVEIGDVTRRFGRTQAVAGVTLETGPGVFGLLGPNGAGKTTLLRMMATVIPPSSGRVRLLGRDPGGYGPRREIRRRLGYLPQNLGYYPGFTVAEFVEYFALLKEMPPGRVPQAVAGAIERVDLGGRARAKLRTLSGGMLRRAGIAQAIVNEPELLLLDEPTAGLDPEQRVAFRALLRDLGERATVIVSTHLVEDVGAACSEVGLMDAGKIVFQGTPDELTARGEGTGAAGDAPLERGYSAVLAAARSARAAA
ncbi:MAG TPA: ABC transporter ATP-binding protein [Streptosporangiaceae bacterium]